jgi:peptidoglycan hydrolase-like protein with peptidoglycan-binding domain
LAWFAITSEFERQTNRAVESTIAKAAGERVQTLRRALLPGDLERAQEVGQSEFKQIVESLQPAKPAATQATTAAPTKPAASEPAAAAPAEATAAAAAPRPEPPSDPAGWPKAADEQIRVIQQALVDLKLLRDKPDGVMGPMTRAAIKSFQKTSGVDETGEPSNELFVALREALARQANEGRGGTLDLGAPDAPPPPPTSADIERSAGKSD